MRHMQKKLAAMVVATMMALQCVTPAVAAHANTAMHSDHIEGYLSTASNGVTLTEDEQGNTVVNDHGKLSIITVNDDGHTMVVSVYDKPSGETNRFILNREKGTLYSSYTNQTIELEPVAVPRSKTSYRTHWISWRQIRSLTSGSGNAGAIAGAIMSLVRATRQAGGVVGAIATIIRGMGGVIPDDPNHGLKVTVQTTKYYRRGNHVPWRTVNTISGVALY